MADKLKNDKAFRDLLAKVITVVLALAIVLLCLQIFSEGRDGRRQVVDESGGEEAVLSHMLSGIEGVGDTQVMVNYDEEENVKGVIVTADGAGSAVVKRDITDAVSALYDIPVSNVAVFEKENPKNEENPEKK